MMLPSLSVASTAPQEESSHVAVEPMPGASCIDLPSCNTPVDDHHMLRMPAVHVEEAADTIDAVCRRDSASSEDSFFSASEETAENLLYISAMKLVQKKEVQCRKNR